MAAGKKYKSGQLLDKLIEFMALKNDAALARKLGVLPPVISNIRHERLPFGPTMILKAHEESGVPVSIIRKWMAA